MHIRPAHKDDLEALVAIGLLLWPGQDAAEVRSSALEALERDTEIAYIAQSSQHEPCGFAMFSLRTDYVEGSTQSPTGYLEAVFVSSSARRSGLAAQLVSTGAQWCKQQGCVHLS